MTNYCRHCWAELPPTHRGLYCGPDCRRGHRRAGAELRRLPAHLSARSRAYLQRVGH